MSWGVSVPSVQALKDGVIRKYDVASGDSTEPFTEFVNRLFTDSALNQAVRDQFEAGSKAALALVASGAVGNPEVEYTFTISGHANPEHKPLVGWSNDFVSVNVYQK